MWNSVHFIPWNQLTQNLLEADKKEFFVKKHCYFILFLKTILNKKQCINEKKHQKYLKTPYYQKTNRDGSGQFFAKLIIMPLPSKHPELLSSTLKPHFCVSFDINYKLRIQIYLQKNLKIRWLLKITRDFKNEIIGVKL